MSMGPKDKTKDLEITISNVKSVVLSDLRLLGLTMTNTWISVNMSVKYANEQEGKWMFQQDYVTCFLPEPNLLLTSLPYCLS